MRASRPWILPRRSHKLLSTAGLTDFKVDDISRPDPKRLKRNLSAVINFCKFREDRMEGYMEVTKETDSLALQKAKLEEENELLLTEVNDAKQQRQREASETAALEADNQQRQVVVNDLFNRQTDERTTCNELKAELSERTPRAHSTSHACHRVDVRANVPGSLPPTACPRRQGPGCWSRGRPEVAGRQGGVC